MNLRVPLVCTLLFTSGFCALVFQTTWFREFRLVFGASTLASSAVLAIFMGGLGLGSALLGKRADRSARPLRFYALLEFSIALTTAASPLLVDLASRAYGALGGQSSMGAVGATAVRIALAALVIGLPTILMGGTLPAAARAVTGSHDASRRGAAWLYAANTMGAVAGALASTLWLVELLGTRGALWATCALNVTAAAGGWELARRWAMPEHRTVRQRKAERRERKSQEPFAVRPTVVDDQPAIPASLIYGVSLAVGCSFFLMESVWYRMLGPLLGGSTFTFGLILAVALAGIGIGGALYPLIWRNRLPSLRALALTCALEALAIAVPLALGDIVALGAAWMQDPTQRSFFFEVRNWLVVAAIVVGPASLVAGVQFPLLIGLLGRAESDLGRQVGLASAWNTVGAIVGALAGGFGLLPALSAPGVWRAVAAFLALLSLALAFVAARRAGGRLPWAAPLVSSVAVVLLLAPGPSAVWRHSGIGVGRAAVPPSSGNALRKWIHEQRARMVWETDGVESSVAIQRAHGLAFFVNGKSDGNSLGDAGTQVMLGMIPAILHPRPESIFVVGLGTGETAGWLAEIPSVTRLDVVELEPAVDEMARRCRSLNFNVLEHPKVRRIYNDAREVLLTARDDYDLIVSEPSNPYRAGVASLFTREFYEAAQRRLRPGGIFAQWVQGYEIDAQTVRTIAATLRQVLPHVEVWQSTHLDLVLLASREPICYPVETLRQRIAQEPFRAALAGPWRAHDLEGFLARRLGGSELVAAFLDQQAVPCNTDDRNAVEYGFARTLGLRKTFSAFDLEKLAEATRTRRPKLVEGDVNWASVAAQWVAMYAAHGRAVPQAPDRPEAERLEREAMARLSHEQWAAGLQCWQKRGRSPLCITETALIAFAYAEQGDPGAEPLLARLRARQSTEADLITGILRSRQRRYAEAVNALVDGFNQLRADPWPISDFAYKAMNEAVLISHHYRQYAPRLFAALDQPFAANFAYEARRRAACRIASMYDNQAAASALVDFEPFVPWTRTFLEMRARVYAAVEHRLARRAADDLERFRRTDRNERQFTPETTPSL